MLDHGADCEALDPDGLSVMQIARMRNDGGVAMLNLLRRHLGASVEVSSYTMKEQVKVPEAYSTLAELEGVLRDNAQLCDRDDPTDWKRAIALGAPDYVSHEIANSVRYVSGQSLVRPCCLPFRGY